MTTRGLLCCLIGCLPLLITGCNNLVVQPDSLVLRPVALGTNTLFDQSSDPMCGTDAGPLPPLIAETALHFDEVGAGFRNGYRRENQCGHRYTFAYQGVVRFDNEKIRDPSIVTIKRATLRLHKRPGMGALPTSLSEDLDSGTQCAELRIAHADWQSGFHPIGSRDGFVPTTEIPGLTQASLRAPADEELAFDVTNYVRRPTLNHPRGYEFAFETPADLLYRNNDAFCLHAIGNMRLEIELDALRPAR